MNILFKFNNNWFSGDADCGFMLSKDLVVRTGPCYYEKYFLCKTG